MALDINYSSDFQCRASATRLSSPWSCGVAFIVGPPLAELPATAESQYKASNNSFRKATASQEFEPYKIRFENLVFIKILSSYLSKLYNRLIFYGDHN